MVTQQHEYPFGWYAVGFTRDIKPGQIVTARLAGADVVVYRTQSGLARVTRPACPHLGAHLGQGRIAGENIVCPFHSFAFGPDGQCVRSGYDTPAPRGARIGIMPIREANGYIFTWYHGDGAPPAWDIDTVDTAGYGHGARSMAVYGNHIIDPVENCVDVGHFNSVHAIGTARMAGAPEVEGHNITVHLELSGFYINGVNVDVHIKFNGLGFMVAQFDMPKIGLRSLELVSYTPQGPGQQAWRRICYATFGGPDTSAWGRRVLDAISLLTARVLKVASNFQLAKDERIWRDRAIIEHPKLAQGDGPIMVARRWAGQFYPSGLYASRDQ